MLKYNKCNVTKIRGSLNSDQYKELVNWRTNYMRSIHNWMIWLDYSDSDMTQVIFEIWDNEDALNDLKTKGLVCVKD